MGYTLGAAARACGMSKTSVLRSIKAGRISAGRDEFGQWAIEPCELHRVYPALTDDKDTTNGTGERAATGGDTALVEANARASRLNSGSAISRRYSTTCARSETTCESSGTHGNAKRKPHSVLSQINGRRPTHRSLGGNGCDMQLERHRQRTPSNGCGDASRCGPDRNLGCRRAARSGANGCSGEEGTQMGAGLSRRLGRWLCIRGRSGAIH